MNRKLILTCVALAAFAAFAVGSSTASATNDPQLTTSTGELVPAGTTTIKVTQVNQIAMVTTAGSTLVTCSTGTGTGEVIKNSGGTVEGEITTLTISGTGTKAAGEPGNECTGSFGNVSVTPSLPVCLRSTPAMATDEMQGSSGKCPGGGKIKFILASTTAGECEFESTGAAIAEFATNPNSAEATIKSTQAGSGVSKIRGGFLCPSSAMFKGSVVAEAESGIPLVVS